MVSYHNIYGIVIMIPQRVIPFNVAMENNHILQVNHHKSSKDKSGYQKNGI